MRPVVIVASSRMSIAGLPSFFRQQLEDPDVGAKARAYVEERRLSEQTSRRFGLGYAPEGWDTLKNAAQQAGIAPIELVRVGLLVAKEDGHHYDRFRDRLIFPVIDAVGRIIGFGGRTLSEDPAKYLNSPESVLFDKSRALYGIHAAKDPIVKQRTAVVVEGYTDCLMAHQFEVANVVATLGTALTAEHAHMLSRYADRVIVVFDSDEAGRKAADRAINIFFAQKVEVRLVSLPEGQDPCDYLDAHGTDAFVELLGTAVEALEYKWRGLQKQLDQTGTIEGKRRITEEFLSVIAHAHHQGNMDTISEGFLVNHVAKLIGAFPQEVHHTLARLKRQSGPRARVENAASETGATTPNEPIARNGYEKAQQVVLETLLNYPDCFERVENVMADPDEFSPGILRRIAGLIWDAHERYGQATITNILATVHDLQLSNILTDMVERGASRGEFDNTLDGALAALAQARNEQERQRVRQAVTTAAVDYGDDAEAAMLLEIQAKYGPNLRRPGAR